MIEREIGRGGMGIVYEAWQPHLDRRVAVKVVAASAQIGAEDRRRWLASAGDRKGSPSQRRPDP